MVVTPGSHTFLGIHPSLGEVAAISGGKPVIRIIDETGQVLAETPQHAPYLGAVNPFDGEAHVLRGYRVASRPGVPVVAESEGQIGAASSCSSVSRWRH